MAKLKDWEDYAKEYGGVVVAWINQAEAKNLKQINSEGVCNGITRDWIVNCRKYRSDRNGFIEKLTARDASGKLLNANVPDEYIKRQEVLSQRVAAGKIEIAKRQLAVQKLLQAKNVVGAKTAVDDMWTYARLTLGGDDCIRLLRFKTLKEVIDHLSPRADDFFVGLGLLMPKTGHIVGLEVQPKQNWFSFIDANSGLFAFPRLSYMLNFIEKAVWPRFYQQLTINLFVMYGYDVGTGGVGESPEELAQGFWEAVEAANPPPQQQSAAQSSKVAVS